MTLIPALVVSVACSHNVKQVVIQIFPEMGDYSTFSSHFSSAAVQEAVSQTPVHFVSFYSRLMAAVQKCTGYFLWIFEDLWTSC